MLLIALHQTDFRILTNSRIVIKNFHNLQHRLILFELVSKNRSQNSLIYYRVSV